jgi:hypothetical protein
MGLSVFSKRAAWEFEAVPLVLVTALQYLNHLMFLPNFRRYEQVCEIKGRNFVAHSWRNQTTCRTYLEAKLPPLWRRLV